MHMPDGRDVGVCLRGDWVAARVHAARPVVSGHRHCRHGARPRKVRRLLVPQEWQAGDERRLGQVGAGGHVAALSGGARCVRGRRPRQALGVLPAVKGRVRNGRRRRRRGAKVVCGAQCDRGGGRGRILPRLPHTVLLGGGAGGGAQQGPGRAAAAHGPHPLGCALLLHAAPLCPLPPPLRPHPPRRRLVPLGTRARGAGRDRMRKSKGDL
mmetsp:Transcript_7194/g.16918  ORF Transcript_7194/g.16918 Transcript_7194/m.16918 type:complete len:211 (+) Transcript_7194:535-1167(+)